MTFRLPFQILRVVSLSRPSSPNKFLTSNPFRHEFHRPNSAFVDVNNNPKSVLSKYRFNIKHKITSLPYHPFQHRFKSTNLENRKKVRKQQKCHERKCERKLVFRNTTKEECEQCIPKVNIPDKCPKLSRLKPKYDASQSKWKHKNCEVDTCNDANRMDYIKGLKIVPKKLTKYISSKCEKCIPHTPTKAPRLIRPERQYDPTKMEQDRICKKHFCDIKAPRMDNILGYKVTRKNLPKLKESSECQQCMVHVPTKAPTLIPPTKQYNPYDLEQKRVCDIDTCNIDPPRMDNVVGLKVECKPLPKLPVHKNCINCIKFFPKCAPELKRPKRKYDPYKMISNHKGCKLCPDCPPRMDDISGYKTVRKTLPKINIGCVQCIQPVPTKLPKLIRPKKEYDDSKLQREDENCPIDICDLNMRIDDIMGCKVGRKKLPKLKISEKCTYCHDVPKKAPKLCRPKRMYDDSKMEWNHNNCEVRCEKCPPRIDDIVGYKVIKKELGKLPLNKSCRVCSAFVPTKAPELKRLKEVYDTKNQEQDRGCNNPCNCPPRMDDIVGLKNQKKKLPKLNLNDCIKCLSYVPKFCPKLTRPKREYDPHKMIWNHQNCPRQSEECPLRMDDIVGCKVMPRDLPTIPIINDCEECVNFVPTYAPILKRPKRKYEINDMPRSKKPDLCDLDPPRMDDIRCWKPKAKILPTFSTKTQTRCYSTFSRVNKTEIFAKLRQKAHAYGRRYKSESKSVKVPPVSNCPKCPKFKLKYCKAPYRKNCEKFKRTPCKKTHAPYESFGDCTDDPWEDEPSECTNWNEVLLQPQKQVSGHFYKLKPPPPQWRHIDPSLARKCCVHTPRPKPKRKVWKNKCQQFKMKNCGSRARQFCQDYEPTPPCDKVEAPYKCFSDRNPQFPEIIKTECDLADKYYNDRVVNYCGAKDPYVTKKALLKARRLEHQMQKVKNCVPIWKPLKKTKCDHKTPKKQKPRFCPKIKKPKKCQDSNKEAYVCKSIQCNKAALVCKSERVELVCICKPVTNAATSKISSRHSSTTNNGEGRDPLKVSSKIKCAKAQANCKCQNPHCCNLKISDVTQQESCKEEPSTSHLPLWQRIRAYFRARPGCPEPHEWKQKELEAKAQKAAAAAGLTLCKPKYNYITITTKKCCCKMMGKKKNPCCLKNPIHCKQKKRKRFCPKCSTTVKKSESYPKSNMRPMSICCLSTNEINYANVKYFSVYSRMYSLYDKPHKKNKQVLTMQSITDANAPSSFYSESSTQNSLTQPYLSLNNNYVGKMYTVKLSKIGIRNALLKQNPQEEPFTICHTCKVIPRYKATSNKANVDIKTVKLKTNSERRKNM